MIKVSPYLIPLLYGALVPQTKNNADQTNSVATFRYDEQGKFNLCSFDVHRRRPRISESAKKHVNTYFPHIPVDYSLLRFWPDFAKVDLIVQKTIALEAQSDYSLCAVLPVTTLTPALLHDHKINDYGIKTYIFTIDDRTKPFVFMDGIRYESEHDEILVVTMNGKTLHELVPSNDDEIYFCVLFEEITTSPQYVTDTRLKKSEL